MKKLTLLLLILVSSLPALHAQATRVKTNNTNAWFMYFGNHRFSEKWGVHLEAQLRRSDFVSEPQQLLLRGGIDYYANSGRFTVGGAFVETYPYGEFAVRRHFPEFRLWEQFLSTQTFGKVKLAHRYRLEQRWIGNATEGTMADGRYENRFRYMARITVPLAEQSKPSLYLAAYDELMVNFGKDVAYNIFDQNRLYAALGMGLSPAIKLEVGYLHQLVVLRSLADGRNRIENNNTLQVGLFSTLAFMRKSE